MGGAPKGTRPPPLRREFSRHPTVVQTSELCSLGPKAKIKILNPAGPGLVMIGVSHALRYVKRGQAELVRTGALIGLKFVGDREKFRQQVAARQMAASTAGYDRAGMRRVDEIKRLPVAGNVVFGITRQTTRSKPSEDGVRPVEHNRPGRFAHVAGVVVKSDGWWCSCRPMQPQA